MIDGGECDNERRETVRPSFDGFASSCKRYVK